MSYPPCPRCHCVLLGDRPEGLCPSCVWAELSAGVLSRPSSTADARDASEDAGTPDWVSRLEPGDRFGAYRIGRLLGRGGMGEVYEAEHVEHQRRVALKVLHQRLRRPDQRTRFLAEGRLAAAVQHPNSVFIFETDEIGGIPVIAMELLPGGTLRDRVRRDGPFPATHAVDATLQVIQGLDAASAAGVLHRDVKPSNCLIAADGTIKIGDFGLSVSTSALGGADTCAPFAGTSRTPSRVQDPGPGTTSGLRMTLWGLTLRAATPVKRQGKVTP
jgi:serine/threonine protein kinase